MNEIANSIGKSTAEKVNINTIKSFDPNKYANISKGP